MHRVFLLEVVSIYIPILTPMGNVVLEAAGQYSDLNKGLNPVEAVCRSFHLFLWVTAIIPLLKTLQWIPAHSKSSTASLKQCPITHTQQHWSAWELFSLFWNTVILDMCIACSFLCFSFLLKCYCLSDAFLDHLLKMAEPPSYFQYSLFPFPDFPRHYLCVYFSYPIKENTPWLLKFWHIVLVLYLAPSIIDKGVKVMEKEEKEKEKNDTNWIIFPLWYFDLVNYGKARFLTLGLWAPRSVVFKV